MEQNRSLLGAVAYDPKVVTIWDGFQMYFGRRGLDFDYILYTNYERQVEALLAGHIRRGVELAAWPGCRPSASQPGSGGGRRRFACATRIAISPR